MKQYTRVFAEIDLDAVCFNMEAMRKNLVPGTKMIGVVKADGYGHGAVPVARAIGPWQRRRRRFCCAVMESKSRC